MKPQPSITVLCPFYRTNLESWSLSRAQVPQQITNPVSVNWIRKDGGLDGKETTCDFGRPRFYSWVRKIPGKGHGYPLQHSCLENPIDRGTWWAMGSQKVGYEWATNTFTLTQIQNWAQWYMSKIPPEWPQNDGTTLSLKYCDFWWLVFFAIEGQYKL